MDEPWDCIVIGGGAAGLSAALALGRARRRTLVIDGGGQSNLAAAGIGGLLGHDHRPPAELYAAGRDELARYPSVAVRDERVTALGGASGGFSVALAGGASERARTVLLATGSDYERPDVPGVAERWGGTVFHCPFCHGWEVAGRPLGLLRGDPGRALLLTAWSDEVTLLTDGPAALEPAAAERLADAGVAVDERSVARLRGPDAELEAVVFADGSERALGGLMVHAPLRARAELALALGAETAEPHPGATLALAADGMGQTTVPGLFAAGDVTGTMPSVANAVAAGARVAAAIVHDLTA